jgi:hypothetical protein
VFANSDVLQNDNNLLQMKSSCPQLAELPIQTQSHLHGQHFSLTKLELPTRHSEVVRGKGL